jgi:hypothetical protein
MQILYLTKLCEPICYVLLCRLFMHICHKHNPPFYGCMKSGQKKGLATATYVRGGPVLTTGSPCVTILRRFKSLVFLFCGHNALVSFETNQSHVRNLCKLSGACFYAPAAFWKPLPLRLTAPPAATTPISQFNCSADTLCEGLSPSSIFISSSDMVVRDNCGVRHPDQESHTL